jgi:PTS system nitrogen regulatory IIA component
MEISEILSQDRVTKVTALGSKKAALESLSRLISSADPTLTQFEVFESLIAREKLGSTGLGHGIAIPHGRRKGGHQTIGAFMKLQTGVNYDAIDQKPVDLLFALLVPEKSTEEHLKVLSKLATIFNEGSLTNSLRECGSAEAIFEILVSQ